jgi:hypothetical protein
MAYIMCFIFYPFLILFYFFTCPFRMIFNFYIIKNYISKTFRDPSQIGSRPTSLENAELVNLISIDVEITEELCVPFP